MIQIKVNYQSLDNVFEQGKENGASYRFTGRHHSGLSSGEERVHGTAFTGCPNDSENHTGQSTPVCLTSSTGCPVENRTADETPWVDTSENTNRDIKPKTGF